MPASTKEVNVDPPMNRSVYVEMVSVLVRLRDGDVLKSSAYTSDQAVKAVPNNLERKTVISLPGREGHEAVGPDL
jgi:hypothetical protein